MSKKRKRVSRHRLASGILAHVGVHNIETGEYKPVTLAATSPNRASFPPLW